MQFCNNGLISKLLIILYLQWLCCPKYKSVLYWKRKCERICRHQFANELRL